MARHYEQEHETAVRALSARDETMKRVIAEAREQDMDIVWKASDRTPLEVIVKSIVSQFLSRHAAEAIYRRLAESCPAANMQASSILGLSDAELEACGLSTSKRRTIRLIATAADEGSLDWQSLKSLAPLEVEKILTSFHGIGAWTAHMFMIFYRRDLDVLPLKDVGIFRGCAISYSLSQNADAKWLEAKRPLWSPYCSIASLYMWRVLHIQEKQKRIEKQKRLEKQTKRTQSVSER